MVRRISDAPKNNHEGKHTDFISVSHSESAVPANHNPHWSDNSHAKDEMFAVTDTRQSPWHVVNAEKQEGDAAERHPPSALDASPP